jgi:monoamine oxidase
VVETFDVLILGGGISGLACAQSLFRNGIEAAVLEARPDTGGRIRTLRLANGCLIEMGAQVVHGSGCSTWDVLRARGLEAQRLPRSEELYVAVDGGHIALSKLAAVPIAPWQLIERLRTSGGGDLSLLRALGRVGLTGPAARIAMEWMVQACGGDPTDVSVEGLALASDSEDIGDEWTLVNGYDQVPRSLAGGLDVRLGCPATRVAWQRGHVNVTTMQGSYRAAAVVVTVPPTIVASGMLEFDPPLPPEKADTARELRLCDAVVVAVELRAPARRSAHVLSADGRGGIWESTAGSPLLFGVAKGAAASALRSTLSDPTELDALLINLVPWYTPGSLAHVHVADWGRDPWSQGGYTYPRTGRLGLGKTWASPVERTLYFAGEATQGPRGGGMVSAAIDSGLRAADEVWAEVAA